ncbi:MAG: hypothetical protein AAGB00_03865 [Planctomycetota bacterium]
MRRLFRNENHDEVEYDRPSLPWVCGHAAEGCPCPLGPTRRGRCPEAPECVPARVGDAWQCTRPASRGGPCDQADEGFDDSLGGSGPTPDGQCCRVNRCRPTHSLRVRRGRIAAGAALFSLGLLLFLLGSPWRNDVLAPGGLTQAHARLLSPAKDPNRCAACHPGGVDAVLGVAPADKLHTTQSQLCVACHESLIDPQLALAAHGLPEAELRRRGDAALQQVAAIGLPDGVGNDQGVACAVCHQEHHGPGHSLTAITNQRCQACHAERYDSFAGDHPDFGNWPYQRRTRINFDHNTHASKHYAAAGEAFDCAGCHQDAPGRDTKLLVGYTQGCARCHDKGIQASRGEGLAVLALPTLDRAAITAAGEALGPWPQAATGDYDGELPAISKLLLAADPAARAALDRLGADFSFFDLDPDSTADGRDAATLAESLRNLLAEPPRGGHGALLKRAASLATIDAPGDLAGSLPIVMVQAARARWFGSAATASPAVSAFEKAERQPAGGWLIDDAGLALRYVPRGHGDPLLRAWIDLAASLDGDDADLGAAALAELAGPKSVGQCATCHSLESRGPSLARDFSGAPGGGAFVNWRAYDARDARRSFTRFSHRPHVTQPELADCSHCHSLDPSAGPQGGAYASLDPRDFVVQFRPLSKAACTGCHKPNAAGVGCAQCHHYHIQPPTHLGDDFALLPRPSRAESDSVSLPKRQPR